MMQKFRVTAERGNGVWVLESENGAVSQVRHLDRVADEMTEAIAYLAGLPVTDVDIEVEVIPTQPAARCPPNCHRQDRVPLTPPM